MNSPTDPPEMRRVNRDDQSKADEESSTESDSTPVEKIELSGAREAKATRLPRAREPLREGDLKDEYVTIIIAPVEGVTQAKRACDGFKYAMGAMKEVDESVKAHCVYEGDGAYWVDPETGKKVQVPVITHPDQCPTNVARLSKYASPGFPKQMEDQTGEHADGEEKKNWSIVLTILVKTNKAMQYIINHANAVLSEREMRMAPKYVQVLCTNVLQAIMGVHCDCCLAGLAMIINQQCEMIEEALQATGVNKKYFGLPVPEVHLSRRVPREPEVHERDRLVELPDATKMYKSILNCEYPVGDDVRMVPVL